jgi:hypothetical protein
MLAQAFAGQLCEQLQEDGAFTHQHSSSSSSSSGSDWQRPLLSLLATCQKLSGAAMGMSAAGK